MATICYLGTTNLGGSLRVELLECLVGRMQAIHLEMALDMLMWTPYGLVSLAESSSLMRHSCIVVLIPSVTL